MMTVVVRRNRSVQILPAASLSVLLSAMMAMPLPENLWTLSSHDYVVAAGFGLFPITLGMMLYMIGSSMIPAPLSATMEAPIGALWAWIGRGRGTSHDNVHWRRNRVLSVFGRLLIDQLRIQRSAA